MRTKVITIKDLFRYCPTETPSKIKMLYKLKAPPSKIKGPPLRGPPKKNKGPPFHKGAPGPLKIAKYKGGPKEKNLWPKPASYLLSQWL